MISFVPFAVSFQKELPNEFPNFVLSIGEIAVFTIPSAFFQVVVWRNEEFGTSISFDFLWLSLLANGWRSRH